ncbi:MAG: SDR family NAD(P)-dependent oxidoreductase [Holophagales bacterium]|jgi:short-subunit dehydrogenase|nr:SDR family NAD(P)-dependent oxidoreductase [Holophagales bacterium]
MKTGEQSIGMPAVLVFNASAGIKGTASALSVDDLAADLNTNLMAPMKAAQFVLPGMRRANYGTILFTGGGIAVKPQADMASGSIGKCALRQLALLLHHELTPENIHVATVTVSRFVQRDEILEHYACRRALRAFKQAFQAKKTLDPDYIAEYYWKLHKQTPPIWDAEIQL